MSTFFTKKDLSLLLEKCKGKSFSTLDSNHVLKRAEKAPRINGIAGDIIEESVLGYHSNSKQEADLLVDDKYVELKTTGLKKTKTKPFYAAKERLTITAVSPRNIINENFENSHFWKKTQYMLFVYYFYNSNKPVSAAEYGDFIFQDYQFFSFNENDLFEIKNEWLLIKDVYTRFQNNYKSEHVRNELRNLNYLEVVAKKTNPRIAISQHYFNIIVREFFGETFEPILKEEVHTSIEEYILDSLKPYIGQKRTLLCDKFNIRIPKEDAKAVNPMLIRKMLNLNNKLENSLELQKANIVPKVLSVVSNKKGINKKTKEAFKVKSYFDINELMHQKWEESELRNYLFKTKFLLLVFKIEDNDQVFMGGKFWQIPITDLDNDVKNTWQKTKQIFNDGVELTYVNSNSPKGYRIKNNLPAMSEHTTLHVRPTASNASYINNADSFKLPTPAHWINRPENLKTTLTNDFMTKQAFWLNSDYMFEQIKNLF